MLQARPRFPAPLHQDRARRQRLPRRAHRLGPPLDRGFLKADVAPGDASLYIDGRGVGSANQFVGSLAGRLGQILAAGGHEQSPTVFPLFDSR